MHKIQKRKLLFYQTPNTSQTRLRLYSLLMECDAE